jgi:gliding motility-associated-like protein
MKKNILFLLGTMLVAVTAFAQPANDACGGAQSTNPNGTCYGGTTVLANDNWVGTVGCAGNNGEVWYSFVATGSQLTYSVTSGTMGGNVELIVVSSTAACAGLVVQGTACGPSPLNGVMNGLQVGTTYYYTISSTGADGTFTTCMTTASPPPVAGQDCPASSVLCTNAPFSQASSAAGFGVQEISPTNSCWGFGGERQSKWYRFTIGCSGTLEFTITPNVLTDDYDWALYNITANPATCGLTLASTPTACNWSGCTGATGISSNPNAVPGVTLCGGPPGPCGGGTYARAFCNETAGNMNVLNVTAGQTYALLIDNFSASNNGFSFSFGGTATIGPNAVFTLASSACGTNVTATKTCVTANSTFLWNFGDGFTSTAQGPINHIYAVPGSYLVTLQVTDALGCVDVYSQTISGAALTSTQSQVNVLCFGGTTGSATVVATSGTGPYTYSWAPSGGSAATASNLAAGTYTVTFTDAGGCVGTASYTITQPASALSAAVGTQTNVLCFGGSTGAASVTASGGTAGYTYNWSPGSPPGDLTPNATGLTAGTWTVVVTDANGCTAQHTYTITQPASALSAATGSQTNVACFGGSTGAASVTPSGGTAGYTYDWTPGNPTGDGTTTATGLTAGTWTVTVTDANGCTAQHTYTITQPASGLSAAVGTQTNVLCFGGSTGAASVTASGGTAGYTYNWSPGSPPGDLTPNATGLTAGTWTVVVTDANGCTAQHVYTITQPPSALSAAVGTQTNVLCFGGSTGAASVTASGGTAGYTYVWSPAPGGGQGTANATGLTAGGWTVTVTDANGCTAQHTYTITQPPSALSAAVGTQTNVICFGGSTGAASVTASGGTAGYTYVWSPAPGGGQGTANATGLTAGGWTVTVTDANGCTAQHTYTITQPPSGLSAAVGTQTNVSCFGGSTGAASVTPSGGTPGYTYDWTPGNPTGDGTANATGLTAGTWSVTVTDASGCTAQHVYTITQPPSALSAAVGTQTNVLCFGGSTGAASVTASGGTAGYTYDWTPGNPTGDGTANATGLTAGTWSVTVTDANGCTAQHVYTITQPASALTASATSTPTSCFGGNNGTATATPSGGTSGYTYVWSPSGGTSATASGLTPACYTVTVTDANGCTTTASVCVTQPTALSATNTSTNATCGNNNGSGSVSPSGGTPGYTYLWSPSGGTAATATGLAAGVYTCLITDANGCTNTQTVTVNNSGGPTATMSAPTNVTCFGGNNGSATVTPVGNSPFTYAWSPSGGTGPTGTNLTAGNYTVVVTDMNGCTNSATVAITQPTAVAGTTSFTPVSCFGGNTGSATVTASGGTAGYTYAWSPTGGTAATASNLTANCYTVTITDANGCTGTSSVCVTEPTTIAGVITTTATTCNGGADGTLSVAASGGTSGYTYAWTPAGGTAATTTPLPAGGYTVLVTDANGCTATYSGTITQPTAITSTSTFTAASCGNSDGTATVTASGGTGALTYTWTPVGGNAATAINLPSGSYTCTITDANGCTQNVTVNVPNSGAPTAAITASANNLCFGDANGSATVSASGGTGVLTYLWSPSGGTGVTETGLVAGNYTVVVTDQVGCSTTQTVVITEPPVLASTTTASDVLCFGGSTGSATTAVTGGTSNYTYLWTPSGGTAATITGVPSGWHTVTITDSNGCTRVDSVLIGEPALLLANVLSSTNVSCNGGSDGVAVATVSGGTPGYSYLWSPVGGTSDTASGIPAGAYTCVVTDSNGCTATLTTTITQPPAIAAPTSSTNASCNASDGTAWVTPSGGVGPYTYLWNDLGAQTTDTATGLPAGSYTVVITDANGCTQTATANVGSNSGMTLTANSPTNVSCFGGSDGTASVNVTGGNGPYTYVWAPSGGTGSTTTPVQAGTYTVTVTDANGCTSTSTATVTQPTQVALALSSSSNVSCNGGTDGAATFGGSGGTPGYSYAWAPSGGPGPGATNLAVGTYTCTLTDANGCSTTMTVAITEPTVLTTATSIIDADCDNPTGSATTTPQGGTGPYTYGWSPSGGNAATASGLSGGNYTVVITDANGCTTTSNAAITNIVTPGAVFGATPVIGPVPLNVTFTDNSTNAVSWQWSFGDNGTSTSQNPAYTYTTGGIFTVTLVVTSASGCTDTAYITIETLAESELTMPNIFTPNADGTNDFFLATQENITTFTCEIYDRWGAMIYTWTDPTAGWSGNTNSGAAAVDGTYYYVLHAEGADRTLYELTGYFQLIR